MNNIYLHILKANTEILPCINHITNVFKDTVKKVSEKIKLHDIDVVCYINPKQAIPEIGLCGFNPTDHIINIAIDPNHADIINSIKCNLPKILAHEFHHIVRSRTIGYGTTLKQVLISEGLADNFVVEIFGVSNIWTNDLNSKQMKNIVNIASQEFESQQYNHYEWFFGTNESRIPRWGGYVLGYQLVKRYLDINKSIKPSILVDKELDISVGILDLYSGL